MRTLAPLLTALLTAPLAAPALAEEIPPPPPPAEDAYNQVEEGLEPEVTINHGRKAVVEEYRANGQVYMVKITPSKGLPYYLIDSDGDGSLETRRNSLDDPEVVQWRLFTW
jgi:hypothetical protein